MNQRAEPDSPLQKVLDVVTIDPPPEEQRTKRNPRPAGPGEKKNRYHLPEKLESPSPVGYRRRMSFEREEAEQLMQLLSLERPSTFVDDPDDIRWHWAHTSNRYVERFEHHRVVEADKIVLGSNGESERILASLDGIVPLTSYLWGDGNLELTAVDADKGAALALIAAQLGVAQEETVAFGDGTNDVTMLRWAGRGVAVGPHASAEVIAVSDERIDAPEEDGVARWLERLLG